MKKRDPQTEQRKEGRKKGNEGIEERRQKEKKEEEKRGDYKRGQERRKTFKNVSNCYLQKLGKKLDGRLIHQLVKFLLKFSL